MADPNSTFYYYPPNSNPQPLFTHPYADPSPVSAPLPVYGALQLAYPNVGSQAWVPEQTSSNYSIPNMTTTSTTAGELNNNIPSVSPGEDLEAKKQKPCRAPKGSACVCAICNVVCNSEVVFADHIVGKKHIAQAQKAAGVCNPNQLIPPAAKILPENIDSKRLKILGNGTPATSPEQDVNNFNAALQRTVTKNAKGAIHTEVPSDSESLSDIDDAEVRSYLLKGDEMLFKKIMWENINEEYTKAEAAKKTAAANAMKLKKEKQQMQAAGAKKARDTAKAANKRTSLRVNYDVLKELLGESEEASEKSKKSPADSYCEDDATSSKNESGRSKFTDWGIIEDNYDEENEQYKNDPYQDYEEGQYYDDGNGDDLF